MEKSTREKDLEYWNSGRMKLCQYDSAEKYFKGRDSNTLTGREIEHIYISEMARQEIKVERLFSDKEIHQLFEKLVVRGVFKTDRDYEIAKQTLLELTGIDYEQEFY